MQRRKLAEVDEWLARLQTVRDELAERLGDPPTPRCPDEFIAPEERSMIVSVTDATFDELVLRAELPVLLDFTADWCPPCRMIEPVLREIAAEQEGRLVVAQLDVDANPAATTRRRRARDADAQPLRRRPGRHAGGGARPKAALLAASRAHRGAARYCTVRRLSSPDGRQVRRRRCRPGTVCGGSTSVSSNGSGSSATGAGRPRTRDARQAPTAGATTAAGPISRCR